MHPNTPWQIKQVHRSAKSPWWHVFAAWALVSLPAMAFLALVGTDPYDPDALLRLQQIRDLMAGQAWFDVTQYRMDPPDGASMHWSRLVDLPVLALILLFATLLPQAQAEFWAMLCIPLLYLGCALTLLKAILVKLGLRGMHVLLGLALVVLSPLIVPAFAPLMIDHHSLQALAMLAMASLFLHRRSSLAAACSGVVAAFWLNISLEGGPAVAVVCTLYGLRYLQGRDNALAPFLAAMAVVAPLLSIATRPSTEFALWCDILLPAHWAAFGAGALIAAVLRVLPRQDHIWGRLTALALFPVICGPLAVSLLGHCLTNPFGGLDPVLMEYWYRHVSEGQPFWLQDLDTMVMMLIMPVLLAGGYWLARNQHHAADEGGQLWLEYALLTAGITLYGLVLLREMIMAQLLLVPFSVLLFSYFMPRARALSGTLPRVFATVAVIFLVTPIGGTLMGKALMFSTNSAANAVMPAETETKEPCDFADLNALERGHVFNTHNSAAAILAHSHHTMEMGGYHRNQDGIRDVILAFIGDEQRSREIMYRKEADYLVICLEENSLRIFAKDNPGSIAERLLRNDPPEWLKRHPDFEESMLQVYYVR